MYSLLKDVHGKVQIIIIQMPIQMMAVVLQQLLGCTDSLALNYDSLANTERWFLFIRNAELTNALSLQGVLDLVCLEVMEKLFILVATFRCC